MSALPVLLDACSGQGGAGRGYAAAGFRVVGVDREDFARRYPYDFRQADAIEYIRRYGRRYEAIHVSPPCQPYTIATAGNKAAREKYDRLIAVVRDVLEETGRPYVIENVELAASEMADPILLCGRMFGLRTVDADGLPLVLDRHRLFESNVDLEAPVHLPHDPGPQVAGVYGGSRRAKRRCPRNDQGRVLCRTLPCPHETYATLAPRDRAAARFDRGGGYVPRSREVKERLLGVEGMTVKGMEESIPPAYTDYIGRQLLEYV